MATQGLGNALGVQEGFDWKSVAISAVSAGAGSYAGDKIADFGAARSWSADTIRNVTVFGATAASGSISAAMRGNLSSQVLLNVGLDALASTMGYAITDAAAAKTAEKNASVGSVERQAIPLETRDVVVDDIAMDIGGAVMTSGLAVGRSVRSMASPASASLVEAAVGLSDHINSPSEERYVDEVVRRAHEAGLEPPDTRSYPMVRAYAENGYVNPGGRGRVAAYGDPVGMASNRDVDRLVRDGQGWGVLANAAIEGSALRLGGISEYRAPSPVTWMGTGSAAAWRDMKTAQSNYHLGPVAAPIGYLGGAAKSLFEMGEFVFGAGKTLAGTMAYVSSFGAMGVKILPPVPELFATSAVWRGTSWEVRLISSQVGRSASNNMQRPWFMRARQGRALRDSGMLATAPGAGANTCSRVLRSASCSDYRFPWMREFSLRGR